MPKLINQNFLTLPQQVGKNKKDIESLENRVGGISTEVDKLVIGELVVKILNPNIPIVIENYGVNTMPDGVTNSLLDYIINNIMLTDKKEPLYVNLKVMGGFVPDINSPTDYTVVFTTTTVEKLDSNEWLFRAVGYSQNVRFEIYAEYEYYADEYRFISQPEIIMVSLISNSVYYAQTNNIIGGVIEREYLSPKTSLIPPQRGDIVIAGGGVYNITSIVGTEIRLNTQTGFIAPTGALALRDITIISNTISNDDKTKVNKITGIKIFNVEGINGVSMEEQIEALGLEFKFGSYMTYDIIGSDEDPAYISRMQGIMAIGIVNTTDNPITLTGLTNASYSDAKRTLGTFIQTCVTNTWVNPVLADYKEEKVNKQPQLHKLLTIKLPDDIPAKVQLGILIKF